MFLWWYIVIYSGRNAIRWRRLCGDWRDCFFSDRELQSSHGGDGDGKTIGINNLADLTNQPLLLQYKTEKDGVVETRVEQKITIQSDGDPIDHDKALAEAIQEAAAMNPEMTVEKIEVQQQTTQ